MKLLHPSLINTLLAQIPGATEIVGVEQGSAGSFVLATLVDGKEEQIEIPKADLGGRLKASRVDLRVPKEATVSDVLQKLSDNYGLYWVRGIDYVASDEPAPEILTVEVPPSSYVWSGSVIVMVHKVTKRCKDPVRVPLDTARVQLLLSQKVFVSEASLFTAKGNLTQKAADEIVAYLESYGNKTLSAKELSGCKVQLTFTDMFTNVAVLSVKGKGNFLIRFTVDKDDTSEPTDR